MRKPVYILNGPNLNLLGTREPEMYGHEPLSDVEINCRYLAEELGLTIRFQQSNAEDQIIGWIHDAREKASAIIINPAGFTTTSIAILDALIACEIPVIEVHISNIHQRERFRRDSYVSLRADGVISGFGTQGYELALLRVARLATPEIIEQAEATLQ
jgi:3-dehydroquinate dehydratase-2